MSTVGGPAASTSAGGPQTPLVLPPGTVIHMIAFAGHEEACEFLDEMVKHVNRHGDGIAHPTIVTTGDQFIRASQAQVPVMLVSAHGPGSETAEPVIGDGKGNRACLRSLGRTEPFVFGARAGIVWDACYTGRPAFRSELARLSAPGAAHVAPVDKIWWPHSVYMARTIFDALLAPGGPPITPASFAAEAANTAASSGIKLWHVPLTGDDAATLTANGGTICPGRMPGRWRPRAGRERAGRRDRVTPAACETRISGPGRLSARAPPRLGKSGPGCAGACGVRAARRPGGGGGTLMR